MEEMPQQRQYLNGHSVLTTIEASNQSGLSHNYIWQLLHSGRLEGIKQGRDWLVYEDSLREFLAHPRTSGPRGPIRKRVVIHQEQGDRVLLSTSEASTISGYHSDHLLRLLRKGVIAGEKTGRNWLIYEDSLMDYKNQQSKKRSSLPSSSSSS